MNIHEMLAEVENGKMMTRNGRTDVICKITLPDGKLRMAEVDIGKSGEVEILEFWVRMSVHFSLEDVKANDWKEFDPKTHQLPKDD